MKIIENKDITVKISEIIVKTLDNKIKHLYLNQIDSLDSFVQIEDCVVRFKTNDTKRANLIGLELKCDENLHYTPIELKLDITPSRYETLSYTNLNIFKNIYEQAMDYYNRLAIGERLSTPPPEHVEYPSARELSDLDIVHHYLSVPPWIYPIHHSDVEEIPPYTFLTIGKLDGKYFAMISLSDKVISYLGPGARVRLYAGITGRGIPFTWIAAMGIDKDVYTLVSNIVDEASKFLNFKKRVDKSRPSMLKGLGWCSWNALNLRDLSDENVIKIVRGLHERGVKLDYVIIDDGWQQERVIKTKMNDKEIHLRSITDLEPDPSRFTSLLDLVRKLKTIGVQRVGLWHTINIHWGGITKELAEKINVEVVEAPGGLGYIPRDIGNWIQLYNVFYESLKNRELSLVKIDNQWIIEALSLGRYLSGEFTREIQEIIQKEAMKRDLEILNCMSTTPGIIFNYSWSNLTRSTIDYVPFWKLGAKLHNYFCVYNNLIISEFTYPDCDMFISYDPYALIHLIFRVISGGPIYITDRETEKTNIDLIKRIQLPSGEIIHPDEPGKPTLDILFKNPFKDYVLLKAYTRIKDNIVVAVGNVNSSGKTISDTLSLGYTPYEPVSDKYLVYSVLKDTVLGIVDPSSSIDIELGELEADIIIYVPLKRDIAVIGLIDYLLPPYPIETDGKTVCSKAPGRLKYYKDDIINIVTVENGSCVDL